MNHQLYEHIGYVPETSYEESPVGASDATKVGANAATPKSECEDLEPSVLHSFSNTPPQPKKSILKKTGFMTPEAKKKVAFKKNRKSISCEVTPRACSPAYRGRNSITREEMANVAFCLENTLELSSKNNSPAVQPIDQIDEELKAGCSSSGNNGISYPEAAGSSKENFPLSATFMMMQLSSPLKKSFSQTQITRLGLQSTPVTNSSCNMESPLAQYSSPSPPRMQEQQ